MDVLTAVRRELKEHVDEKTQASYHRHFKEKVTAYGVKTATVGKIGVKYFNEIKRLGKKDIFALCEELFKSDYSEESFIAAEWAHRVNKQYTPDDFAVFERWIADYINNWAKCDTLCNHAVGDFIMMYPQFVKNLKGWTNSENRWLKRAAAVTLILPARKGHFLNDVFEIADSLLLDKDDLVRKGYGWMLKEASRLHTQEVFDYIIKNKKIMPRTALRYAIEKMPPDLRKQAMEK
jgi:3-methyladenine DNA glycosylase AlkD